MHRKPTLSLRVRIMMKLGLVKYCRCNRCYGGEWQKNHSDIKYITPNVLRPFDDTRHYFEQLTQSFKVMLDI